MSNNDKTATAEKALDSSNAQKAPRRRGGLIAGLALLIALLAVAGSAFLFWTMGGDPGRMQAWQETQDRLQKNIASLRAHGTALEGKLAEVTRRNAELEARIKQSEEQAAAVVKDQLGSLTRTQESLQDRVSEISADMARVQRPVRKDRDWRLLANAARLLRMANERLQFALDDAGAMRAQRQAAGLLAKVSQPEAAAVLRTLKGEQTALDRRFPIRVAEALQDLTRLDAWLTRAPLAGAEAGEPVTRPHGWWAALRLKLTRLVRVEATHDIPPGHWSQDAQRMLRLRVRLDLSAARLALIGGQGTRFAELVGRIVDALHRNFEPLNPDSVAASERLRRAATAWQAPLPTYSKALHGIDTLMATMGAGQ